jgi:hypothetical protein
LAFLNQFRAVEDGRLPLFYCDQNVLSTFAVQDDGFKIRLRERLAERAVQIVLSSWHWCEMARNATRQEALRQAEFADTLYPTWLRDRVHLQREEVADAFFSWLRVPFVPQSPTTSLAGVVSELNGIPIQRAEGITSSDVVGGWYAREDLLAPLVRAHQQIQTAFGWTVKNLRLLIREKRKVDVAVLSRLMPDVAPSGVAIDAATKERFVNQFNLENSACKVLMTEQVISELSWSLLGGLRWQHFIDRMHLVPSLPNVEYFLTNDRRLGRLVHRVATKVRFRVAELIDFNDFSRRFL